MRRWELQRRRLDASQRFIDADGLEHTDRLEQRKRHEHRQLSEVAAKRRVRRLSAMRLRRERHVRGRSKSARRDLIVCSRRHDDDRSSLHANLRTMRARPHVHLGRVSSLLRNCRCALQRSADERVRQPQLTRTAIRFRTFSSATSTARFKIRTRAAAMAKAAFTSPPIKSTATPSARPMRTATRRLRSAPRAKSV